MRVGTVLAVAGLLACFFFSAGLGPLLESLLYTMMPLERYYAADYLAASWGRNDPQATTGTRLLWKERVVPGSPKPKAKRPESKIETELARERDVTPRPMGERIGKYDAEPFQLSEAARAEGWMSVSRGVRRRVSDAALYGFLESDVYDGQPLWKFAAQPAAGMVVLFAGWLTLHLWRRRLRARYPWRTDGEAMWLTAWAWSAASANRLSRSVEARAGQLRRLAAPAPEKRLELPAPRQATWPKPQPPVAVAPVASSPTPRPVVVPQPAAVPRPAYVWDETQGID